MHHLGDLFLSTVITFVYVHTLYSLQMMCQWFFGAIIYINIILDGKSSPVVILSTIMTGITLLPLSLPPSASDNLQFGREVKGVNPGQLSEDEFRFIEDALYKVRATWKDL